MIKEEPTDITKGFRPHKRERTEAILFATTVVVAIALLLLAYQAVSSKAPGPGLIRASLEIRTEGRAGGDWKVDYKIDGTANNTAFGILKEAAEKLGLGLGTREYRLPPGVYVYSINGTAENPGSGYGWEYWVNGRYGELAADRKELIDDDHVLWAYRKG